MIVTLKVAGWLIVTVGVCVTAWHWKRGAWVTVAGLAIIGVALAF